jgi:phosphatidylserine/phosphatidylglycerophosphate/cardiolipin synthase-like enzyme
MALPVVFLLLLFAAPAAAAEKGRKSTVVPPAEDCGIRLLADREYLPALLTAIDRARQEIVLSAFFFKTNGFPDHQPDQVLAHLQKAAGRGVRVAAVLERGPEGDNVSPENRITAERLERSGISVCLDAPDRTTHAKLFVIDRRILFIGSHNLTQSALKYNREVSVRIDSPALAEEALRYLKSICP